LLKHVVLARCWIRFPRHVSTTSCLKVLCFVSRSWKIWFLREISEDLTEDMNQVTCASKNVW